MISASPKLRTDQIVQTSNKTLIDVVPLKQGLPNVLSVPLGTLFLDTNTTFLTYKDTSTTFKIAGSGTLTNVANVGIGTGDIFRDITGTTVNLKTILAGPNISVTNNANEVQISVTPTLSEGIWTPIYTGLTGTATYTPRYASFIQTGNTIAGQIWVDANVTALNLGQFSFTFTLPIARAGNFVSVYEFSGTGNVNTALPGVFSVQGFGTNAIVGTNDTATAVIGLSAIGLALVYISFQYRLV